MAEGVKIDTNKWSISFLYMIYMFQKLQWNISLAGGEENKTISLRKIRRKSKWKWKCDLWDNFKICIFIINDFDSNLILLRGRVETSFFFQYYKAINCNITHNSYQVFFFLWQIGQFAEKRMWVEDHVWDRWWSCRPAGWGTWRAWGWESSCLLPARPGVGACIVEDLVLFFLIHNIKFLFRQENFLQGSLTEVVTMIRKHRLRAAASPVATISPIAIVNASKIGISKILVSS